MAATTPPKRPVPPAAGPARVLVKLVTGNPIEMFVTCPDLEVRPPDVIQCFLEKLRRTRFESCRRTLDARHLSLVDCQGDALAVSRSLREARVKSGDALLLLPSVRRLKALASPTEVEEDNICWVRLQDATWRPGRIEREEKELVFVRWSAVADDEPEVAQVERPRIRRDRPNRMLAPPPELKVKKQHLRRDGSLRIKVSWRLGAPEEALGAWLVIHAKDVERAKPPQILESFAQALCKKRPRLRWRIQYECLQLFSVDGTPLLDDVPLVESLARVSSDELLALPRIRCLSEETQTSSSPRGWLVDDGGALAACRLCSGGKVGGDTVLIRTDRRVAGAARYRQVKRSQVLLVDDVSRQLFATAQKKASRDDDEAVKVLEALRRKERARDLHDKSIMKAVLPEFRRNGKLVVRPPEVKKGEFLDCVFPHRQLGISLALVRDAASGRRYVGLDKVTPSCPPRVAVALRRGDLLVHVDQEPVDSTDEGYEKLVARLRCGSRPVVLKFWKRSDVESTEKEEVPLTIQVPESPKPRTLRADELSPSSEVEEFDACVDLDDHHVDLDHVVEEHVVDLDDHLAKATATVVI